MSFEGMCARIKRMHAELEELEKALNEGVMDEGGKWEFPEGNYTVLAIALGLSSCNVTRTVTTRSEAWQKGDTSCVIQTKTIETYDASKKGL